MYMLLTPLQVIFDSLFGGSTNTKLRVQTLQFVHHVCTRHVHYTQTTHLY